MTKAMSRESPAQKAAHVLDTDLRSHWSTSTNTKEWIMLKLDVNGLTLSVLGKLQFRWSLSNFIDYGYPIPDGVQAIIAQTLFAKLFVDLRDDLIGSEKSNKDH